MSRFHRGSVRRWCHRYPWSDVLSKLQDQCYEASTYDPDSGKNETPRTSVVMVPCDFRLSKTVGTVVCPETVSSVKSTGPKPMMLHEVLVRNKTQDADAEAHPSTPSNPDERVPSPTPCLVTVRPPTVTVSVNSVPLEVPVNS
jgi:hypothetical protein